MVSSPKVSWPFKNTETDEITWADFEVGSMLKKIDPISSLIDWLQNYLRAGQRKWTSPKDKEESKNNSCFYFYWRKDQLKETKN